MRRRSAVAAVVVVVVVLGVGVGLVRKPERPAPSPDARERAATAELRRLLVDARPLPIPPDSPSQAKENAWWNGPFASVFDSLRAAAEAGDVAAAHALGSRSADCMKILRDDTPASLLADFQDETHFDRFISDRFGPEQIELRRQNVARQFAQRLDRYENCAAIGAARMADYLRWLERAGAAGSATAKLRYVSALQTAYSDDRGALIAQIEEAGRRRALARTWLEDLVRSGDESAFYAYSEALKGSWLYREDYASAMAHVYALELAQSRRMGNFQQRWQQGMRGYDNRLTPAQWAEVSRRGREIFVATLQDRPIWPNGSPPPNWRPPEIPAPVAPRSQ